MDVTVWCQFLQLHFLFLFLFMQLHLVQVQPIGFTIIADVVIALVDHAPVGGPEQI